MSRAARGGRGGQGRACGRERHCCAFGAPRRRGAMAAVVVDLAAFAAIAAHICATRLLARLSHGTARMRTATAHDAARTRARQGHSQGCCGGTAARTRRTRITQAGSGSTHARAPPARARAGGATSAGRRAHKTARAGDSERASRASTRRRRSTSNLHISQRAGSALRCSFAAELCVLNATNFTDSPRGFEAGAAGDVGAAVLSRLRFTGR